MAEIFLKETVKKHETKRIDEQFLEATSKDPDDEPSLSLLLLYAGDVFVATVLRLAQYAEAKLVKYSDLR